MSDSDRSAENERERLDGMRRDDASPYWDDSDRLVDLLVAKICGGIRREDREELAQDVKLAARASLATFHHSCTWKTWLTRIVINKLRDFLRKTRRMAQEDALDGVRHDRANTVDIEAECIAREEMQMFIERLMRCIQSRTNRERAWEIVQGRLDGLSNEAIAERLHISAQTVANVLFAMRKYLRERYPRDDAGGAGKPPHEPGPPGPTPSSEKGE